MMGKRLEVACFCTSVFPIIPVFPRFSRKKRIEQLLSQSLKPTFSVWSRRQGSGNLREQVVSIPFLTTSFFSPNLTTFIFFFRLDDIILFPTNQFLGGLTNVPVILIIDLIFFRLIELLPGLTNVPALHSTI